ncbi:hypothetical protein RM533_08145 [Croceicoccus sp. F390]|uniref:GtrA-like protein domain-containing protein n=1 Tax=Croceicoccus esteveae TaxID=3075597 RepID=A0ABU2ZHS0_9SPHN|nr:hypothetical protein [Croceicoccus sp. F390]MDT0576157.1 hypothetical protein [Croceicoccus sp. F390]
MPDDREEAPGRREPDGSVRKFSPFGRPAASMMRLAGKHSLRIGNGGYHGMTMALLVTFMLGIANFAMHRAVLESGHRLLGRMPWFVHLLGGRFSLVVEFSLLLATMLLVASGSAWVVLAYLGYSLLNALAAWLILSQKI